MEINRNEYVLSNPYFKIKLLIKRNRKFFYIKVKEDLR